MPSFADDFTDDLISLSVDLARAETGTVLAVRKSMRQLERALIDHIKQSDIDDVALTSAKQRRLDRLLKQTQQTIKESYGGIAKLTKKDTISFVQLAASETLTGINSALTFPLATTALAPSIIREIVNDTLIDGAKSAEWWGTQASGTNAKFKREMRDALYKGESIQDMVRRTRGTYNPQLKRYVGGIMDLSTRQAESLVRTSVVNLQNTAKLAVYDANDDVIGGIEWLSSLDSRTTQICRGLDGLEWDLSYKPIGHSVQWPGPTAHWGCRSTQIPIVKPFNNLPKKKQDLFKGDKVARDKHNKSVKVPSTTTYDSWLKKQSVAKQKDILGVRKRELWKNNKLTQKDMIDFSGRPLTIEELEKRYNK